MDISIAMCTYNGSRFLDEQLSSIREQTKLPHELIICDDGSADATRGSCMLLPWMRPSRYASFAIGRPGARPGTSRRRSSSVRARRSPYAIRTTYGYPTNWNGWQVFWIGSRKWVAFARMPS